MEFANIIVIFLLTYYLSYCFKLLLPRNRTGIKQTNVQLQELRCKTYKTLEEQKKFLDLKHPKTIGTFKFKWSMLPKLIFHITIFIIIFQFFSSVFLYFGVVFKFWQAMLFIVFFPIGMNLILEKFNLQKGDLRYLMRW